MRNDIGRTPLDLIKDKQAKESLEKLSLSISENKRMPSQQGGAESGFLLASNGRVAEGQKERRERAGYGEGAMVVYTPNNHYY